MFHIISVLNTARGRGRAEQLRPNRTQWCNGLGARASRPHHSGTSTRVGDNTQPFTGSASVPTCRCSGDTSPGSEIRDTGKDEFTARERKMVGAKKRVELWGTARGYSAYRFTSYPHVALRFGAVPCGRRMRHTLLPLRPANSFALAARGKSRASRQHTRLPELRA